MVVIADLALRHGDFCGIISQLLASPELAHVPVLGYCDSKNHKLVEAALEAGAKLVAAERGIPDQLAQLLDHVLAVE
jgi:DNA-binding NarL/FixJ family response regulator